MEGKIRNLSEAEENKTRSRRTKERQDDRTRNPVLWATGPQAELERREKLGRREAETEMGCRCGSEVTTQNPGARAPNLPERKQVCEGASADFFLMALCPSGNDTGLHPSAHL